MQGSRFKRIRRRVSVKKYLYLCLSEPAGQQATHLSKPRAEGYYVSIRARGCCFEKAFRPKQYGSQESSYSAALKWRDERLDAHNIPKDLLTRLLPTFSTFAYRTNRTTGVVGVNFDMTSSRFSAQWRNNKKGEIKSFSIKKYGHEAAFQLALAFRKERIAQFYGYIRNIRVYIPHEQEIIQRVKAIIPAYLPIEVKEDVQQEMILAILGHTLNLNALDASTARLFIRRLNKSYSNPYSHISLDHLVGEGCRLEDVLEG
jgi:hypothetical protein